VASGDTPHFIRTSWLPVSNPSTRPQDERPIFEASTVDNSFWPSARCAVIVAIVALPCVCFAQGLGGRPNVAPDLAALVVANAANPNAIYNVIVQFRATPSREELAQINGGRGAQQDSDLSAIGGQLYSMPFQALAGLANDPNVAYLSPDRPVQSTLDVSNPATGAQTALLYGWNGTGVGVAILDSGILLPQTDLLNPAVKNASRVVYSQSFVSGQTGTSDQYGHGTHVAGIVAGNGANSTGSAYTKTFRGIAPAANLINLRVLDSNGAGKDSAVISAISAAIKLKSTYNIRVINLSLGRPVYESYALDPLCQAVEKAWKAGIVVVVAAGNQGRDNSFGNSGYATITAPGNDPLVITVGAMKNGGTISRLDDLIASYSSKGPTLIDHVVKPDIVAPGNKTVSLLASKSLIAGKSTSSNSVPYTYYQNTTNTAASANYYRLSGTSMAAPMVSGAAALMLNRDPALSPDTIKARLMLTATKAFPLYSTATDPVTGSYTSQYDIFTIGAGYLDIWGALNSAAAVPAGITAASPTAIFDASTNSVSLSTGNTLSGTGAVWGTGSNVFTAGAVWGTSVFLDGSGAVWGTDTNLWGAGAVWGTGGTTSNSTVWGSGAVWGTTTNDASETLNLLINGEN
jgi:serine protease AprX